MYLYKAAYVTPEQLLITMGHEYAHAFFFQYPNFQNTDFEEHAIKLGDYYQAKALNYRVNDYYVPKYTEIAKHLSVILGPNSCYYVPFLPTKPTSIIFFLTKNS